MINAKYVHTNLIADDWWALSDFYQQLFGCVPVPPERDFRGEPLEAGTGIPGARLRGVHLRLPGYGEAGPTLEIFSYDTRTERGTTAVDRPGLGHIVFSVADVADVAEARNGLPYFLGLHPFVDMSEELTTDELYKVCREFKENPDHEIPSSFPGRHCMVGFVSWFMLRESSFGC